MDTQNASTVCPESVRPLRSAIVTEIISGTREPRASKTSAMATSAAFALSVSKIVSTSSRSQPPSSSPRACSAYAPFTCWKVTSRNAGLFTSRDIESVRLVGPMAPATSRGRSGVRAVQSRAASQARRAAVTLSS